MRKRVEHNKVFYHIVITDLGQITVSWRVEKGDAVSTRMFESGNYFETEKEAEAEVRKIKEMLKIKTI